MDPGVVIFLWAGLQVYYMWRFIERRRGTRTRQRKTRVSSGTPSNYVYVGDNRQVWVGGDKVHPSQPTLEERLDEAFYQAWIEPTMEIINRIDAECPDPEPVPEFYTDDFGQTTCVPCDHATLVPVVEYDHLEEKIRLQQEYIRALEARLKELADYSIQQNLKYGSTINTKRIWR